MRQESVDAIRPQRAVPAALPHVVDREEPVVPREELAQPHLAGEGPKGVVRNLAAGGGPARCVELGRKLRNLRFQFGNDCVSVQLEDIWFVDTHGSSRLRETCDRRDTSFLPVRPTDQAAS